MGDLGAQLRELRGQLTFKEEDISELKSQIKSYKVRLGEDPGVGDAPQPPAAPLTAGAAGLPPSPPVSSGGGGVGVGGGGNSGMLSPTLPSDGGGGSGPPPSAGGGGSSDAVSVRSAGPTIGGGGSLLSAGSRPVVAPALALGGAAVPLTRTASKR